ncbi:hypothetical protein ABIF21_008943 [Bradyrhizobium elkanii]
MIIVLTMFADCRNSPRSGPALDVELHGLQQVALRHRGDRAGDFAGRPQQIVDQRVDRTLHIGPGAAGEAEIDALAGLSLAADDLADARQLLRHALVGGCDFVEGVRDLAVDAEIVAAHPNREVAGAHRLQRLQQVVRGIEASVG